MHNKVIIFCKANSPTKVAGIFIFSFNINILFGNRKDEKNIVTTLY